MDKDTQREKWNDEEICCGTCKHCVVGDRSSDYGCNNERSEYYGCYTMYDDVCNEYEGR